MEPHTQIRLHRHDYGNVVTLGLSGDARGLDITTRIRPKPEHSTPYLSVRDKADDDFRQIYEALWED